MLLLNVDPLDFIPGRCSAGSVNWGSLVLELVLHIRLPGDTFLVDRNADSWGGLVENLIRVGENTLGDESAGDGRTSSFERYVLSGCIFTSSV